MKNTIVKTGFLIAVLSIAATAFAQGGIDISELRKVPEPVMQTATQAESIPGLWWIAPIASAMALVFALVFYKMVMSANPGNKTMIEIAQHVKEGAYAYLSVNMVSCLLCSSFCL